MAQNNLCAIIKPNHLSEKLHKCRNEFVVLALTIEDVKKSTNIILKKYIKEKSQIYPKVNFLYYEVKKNDLDRLNTMFEKNNYDYPMLFHIFDIEKILEVTVRIDCKEAMEPMFKKLHEPYSMGETYIQQQQRQQQRQKELQQDDVDYSDENEHDEPQYSELKKQQSKKKNNHPNTDDSENLPMNPEQYYSPPVVKDPQLEQRKRIEKYKLLMEKKQECLLEFWDDVRKRKKDEEKKKKKKEKRK
jgi:hypothetical protein